MISYSNTLFRDIINRIGDPNNPAKLFTEQSIQNFRNKKAFTDLNALKLIRKMSDDFANQAFINTLLANKQTAAHNTFVDLWNVPSLTVSSNLTFAGFNAGSTQRMAIPTSAFTLYAFKFDINVANSKTWGAFYNENGLSSQGTLKDKMLAELAYYMYYADAAIKQQLNTDLITFIDSSKATGGGAGTRYTAVGNTKQIPVAEPYEDAFPGIVVDGIMSNRFYMPSLGEDPATMMTKCAILGDPNIVFAMDQARIRGVNNRTNHNMLLQNYANIEATNAITVANPVTDDFRAYLIDRGGISVNTWVPDMTQPAELENRNNYYETKFTVPSLAGMEIENLMNYNMIIRKMDFQNDFGTYATEESRNNPTFQGIIYTYGCFTRPTGAVAADRPVIEYVKLK